MKQTAKLLSSAAYRKEQQCFVAEGARLCRDGVQSGANVKLLLYTRKGREKYAEEFSCIAAVCERKEEVSEQLLKRISDTDSPQGLLCVFKTLDKNSLSYTIKRKERYAALERIQDPSNMGTILRTAEALGVNGVILSQDCCDIYSPKVVRGSMGAIFRLSVTIVEDFTEYMAALTEKGIMTYASTPHEADSLAEMDFSQGGVMLIGNEGNGLKEETIRVCARRVRIPMTGRAESLNAAAAAAILLYELQNRE